MKTYYKKKYLKIFSGIILCLLLTFPLFQPGEAKAQGPSFSVAPHSFNVSALAGEEVRQKIKIINRGETAIPMRVRVDGFTAEDETGDMVASGGDAQENLTDWFKFDKNSFMVEAGKTETVDFTVKVPVSAPLKGYYAVVFIEADISPFVYNESQVQTIPGIGAPFLLKVGNQDIGDSLAILDYQVSEEHRLKNFEKVFNFLASPFFEEEVAVTLPGKHSFFLRIKNDGIYHSKVSGNIRLSGLGWKLDDEMEIPPFTILPGKTRKILIESRSDKDEFSAGDKFMFGIRPARADEGEKNIDKKTGFGLMKASLNIELDDGTRKEESRWVFVFSWWLVAIFFLGLVLIFVFYLLLSALMRKRKKINFSKYKKKFFLKISGSKKRADKFFKKLFAKKRKSKARKYPVRKTVKKRKKTKKS